MLEFVATSSPWVALAGWLYWVFSVIEESLRPDSRAQISRWLYAKPAVRGSHRWPEALIEAFDAYFGKKRVSIRFVSRVSLVSFSACLVLTLFWAARIAPRFQDPSIDIDALPLIQDFDPISAEALRKLGYVWLWSFVFFNLPADYVSTIETRLVLSRIASASFSRAMLWLVFDAVLSMAIFVTVFSFALIVWGTVFADLSDPIGSTTERVSDLFENGLRLSDRFEVGPRSMLLLSNGIFLYSTLSTSLWVWASACANTLVRIVVATDRSLQWLQATFDVETRPLRTLGIVVATPLASIGLALGLVGSL